MNITVENLAPCKKLVRVEVEAQKVDETFESITKDFQRQAALPGFRPGKAPRDMVVRKYNKDIEDEVKRKLISDSYKKALDEKNIDVLGYPDIEEIQFSRGQALQFAATIETAPEFELPEYKGLPVKRTIKSVTDQDVDSALDRLREPQATYVTLDRPLQMGDIAVVNYTATSDGKPLTEIAPTAKGLTEQKSFWVDMAENSFVPGLATQLQGAKAGEKRTINVEFPADFVTPELAGKKAVYEVEVVEVKEKKLPPIDDSFAKTFSAENLEKLKEGVRRDLENELKFSQSKNIRSQLVRAMLDRVNFELPESALAKETRNVVYNLVQENARRGLSRDMIEGHKEQIYTAAAANARERVKFAFLMQKVAEKEDIKVSDAELSERIVYLSRMYDLPPQKFAEDLRKKNGLIEVYDQVMNEKVLEFLEKNAKIEDVEPAAAEAVGTNPS